MTKDLVPKEESMITQKHCRFTPRGLLIDRAISLDEWQELGQMLKGIADHVQFWIGDWLKFGVGKFGEKAYQVTEPTNREYGTLANYQYVASHVPPENRNEKLSFSHHQVVAKLEKEDQKKFLDLAEKDNLSVTGLRNAVDDDAGVGKKRTKKQEQKNLEERLGIWRDGLKRLDKRHSSRSLKLIIQDIGELLEGQVVRLK